MAVADTITTGVTAVATTFSGSPNGSIGVTRSTLPDQFALVTISIGVAIRPLTLAKPSSFRVA
jgi:hypothetical protein